MEQMNMNIGAQMPPMPEEKKPVGAIISIIVIVLILAFGAYYFMKQVPAGTTDSLTPAETQADQAISALSTQGTSTELADIQKDLDATNLTGLDAGLSDVAI